jgi:hypothetical protein
MDQLNLQKELEKLTLHQLIHVVGEAMRARRISGVMYGIEINHAAAGTKNGLETSMAVSIPNGSPLFKGGAPEGHAEALAAFGEVALVIENHPEYEKNYKGEIPRPDGLVN